MIDGKKALVAQVFKRLKAFDFGKSEGRAEGFYILTLRQIGTAQSKVLPLCKEKHKNWKFATTFK